MRALVVEDERRLAENIAQGLREASNYAVDVCHDGEDAVALCETGSYDLIVLDLMLPQRTGEEVLTHLRSVRNATPVMILTAVSDIERVIRLLDGGADDYMTKPFDLGELVARCRALIRRSKGTGEPVLRFGSTELHTAEQAVLRHGQVVDLTPTEYRIVEYLLHRPRVIVSKRELLEHLYDFTWEHHSNVIEVHMSNLRKKLRVAPGDADVIETLRNRGYRLAQC